MFSAAMKIKYHFLQFTETYCIKLTFYPKSGNIKSVRNTVKWDSAS
jgi:hypothetical protein